MSRQRFAVVPTRLSDPKAYRECVAALQLQHVHVITVAHNCADLIEGDWMTDVLPYDKPTPNISRMWNLGLDFARALALKDGVGSHDVAVINDDAIVPEGWFYTLQILMHRSRAAAAFSSDFGARPVVRSAPYAILAERMTGYAFMLNGDKDLRLDEQFEWWYGDDDLDWRASRDGGIVMVPGLTVKHLHPDESTNASAELQKIAGADRARFVAKHGRTPH